ncbi:MAG: DUF5131 family protein [bacterium]
MSTKIEWVRNARDQCQAAGLPFFFKGWGEWAQVFFKGLGEWAQVSQDSLGPSHGCEMVIDDRARTYAWMKRVGKKRAGRLLDGREWDEMPEVRR